MLSFDRLVGFAGKSKNKNFAEKVNLALRRTAHAGQQDRLPGVQPSPRQAVRGLQGVAAPGGLRPERRAADRRGLAGPPGRLRHGADVVPAVAPGEPRAGQGDERSWQIDAEEAGRVPGRTGPGAGDRAAASGADLKRRDRATPDRPVGNRPLGGRVGEAA